MTILYLFRAFNLIFLGEAKTTSAREGSKLMVACVVVLAVLSLAGGIFVNYPAGFARSAAMQMMGVFK